MRAVGIDMFAVGVAGAQTSQLQEIANDPDEQYMYQEPTFEALASIAQIIPGIICQQETLYTTAPLSRDTTIVPFEPESTLPPFNTNPENLCETVPMDLVFVVDGSTSVRFEENGFSLLRDFVYDVADQFTVGPNKTRVAMLQYSYLNRVEFSYISSKTDLLTAITNVQHMTGSTFTGSALSRAYTDIIEENQRDGVRQVVVVITDGRSLDDVQGPANSLRANGIDVYGVGVGGGNNAQLPSIANDPDEHFVVVSDSFAALGERAGDLVEEICAQNARFTSVPPTELRLLTSTAAVTTTVLPTTARITTAGVTTSPQGELKKLWGLYKVMAHIYISQDALVTDCFINRVISRNGERVANLFKSIFRS